MAGGMEEGVGVGEGGAPLEDELVAEAVAVMVAEELRVEKREGREVLDTDTEPDTDMDSVKEAEEDCMALTEANETVLCALEEAEENAETESDTFCVTAAVKLAKLAVKLGEPDELPESAEEAE